MKLKSMLIACFVLLTAVPLAAQSPGADPVSGAWKLDGGGGGLELKFDGKGAVSGLVNPGSQSPGEIRTGTFDPKTGALKLEGDIKGPDGAMHHFVIEGQIAQSTITGSASFDNQKREVRLTKVVGTSAAPQPGAGDSAALRESFGKVSGWVMRAAELVPADKYNYRPASSVRTFGQLIGHIADSYNYNCAIAAGRNVQWSDAIEKGSTDKATLVQKLKQAGDACNAAYSRTGQAGALIENIGHTNLHYGNIVTYMRLLGLVPPSN
ncbi:MAG TPA: DinB family protein [Blastocatellia bacterium]|nr:DinB family protein [Blastocatellia bacterium]